MKSKKIPHRIETTSVHRFLGTAGMVSFTERKLLYQDWLDEDQRRAIDSARDLAATSGIKLVIEDLSKQNPFLRALKRLVGRNAPCNPMLLLPCEIHQKPVRPLNLHCTSCQR